MSDRYEKLVWSSRKFNISFGDPDQLQYNMKKHAIVSGFNLA